MSYASDALIDMYSSERINKLQAENTKLKQELEAVGIAAYLYGRTDLTDEHARVGNRGGGMSGIKYYQLKEDEELPDEFCAVKDVNGEPSEYTFYRPETENAKLRELVRAMKPFLCCMPFAGCNTLAANVRSRMQELGI